jgi:hypothetical protein
MQKKTLFFNKIISFKNCGYHKLQPKDELLTFFLKYRRNVQAKNTIFPTKIFLQRLKMPGFSKFGDLVDFFNCGSRTAGRTTTPSTTHVGHTAHASHA